MNAKHDLAEALCQLLETKPWKRSPSRTLWPGAV